MLTWPQASSTPCCARMRLAATRSSMMAGSTGPADGMETSGIGATSLLRITNGSFVRSVRGLSSHWQASLQRRAPQRAADKVQEITSASPAMPDGRLLLHLSRLAGRRAALASGRSRNLGRVLLPHMVRALVRGGAAGLRRLLHRRAALR